MAKVITPLNSNEAILYFKPVNREDWILKDFSFKASTAIPYGTAVGIEISSNTTTGNLTLMGVENASGADFKGIIQETIATTDSDYATAGKIKKVLVPRTPLSEAYFTVGAGTFTAVDVHKTVEIHSDSKSLAVDTAGKGARITGYINSTTGTCNFNLPTTETA